MSIVALVAAALCTHPVVSSAARTLAERLLLHAATTEYRESPKPCNELGALLVQAGRPRAALRQYETALSRSAEPDDDDGWDASINIALCLVTLAEARPLSDHWCSRMPEARRLVHRCIVSTPSDQRLLALLHRSNALGAPCTETEARNHQLIIAEASDSHQRRAGEAIVRSWTASSPTGSASAGTLLICFAGADANLGGGIKGGMPSHEFVSSCRRAGVSHALFVRDCLRAWYTRGIGIGAGGSGEAEARSFEGVIAELRREIDAVRPARVATIGSSMGGYAAVRAGLALDADVAVAFSPQVIIDAADREARELPHAPFDGLLRTLATLAPVAGVPTPSLVECALAAPSHCRTAIELHAGTADPGDVYEALLLEAAVAQRRHTGAGSTTMNAADTADTAADAAVSCVLNVHEGRDHNLVKEMRDAGELHELLQRIAGVGAAAAQGDGATSTIVDGFVGFRDCGDL